MQSAPLVSDVFDRLKACRLRANSVANHNKPRTVMVPTPQRQHTTHHHSLHTHFPLNDVTRTQSAASVIAIRRLFLDFTKLTEFHKAYRVPQSSPSSTSLPSSTPPPCSFPYKPINFRHRHALASQTDSLPTPSCCTLINPPDLDMPFPSQN